jgi:hypothetical protein
MPVFQNFGKHNKTRVVEINDNPALVRQLQQQLKRVPHVVFHGDEQIVYTGPNTVQGLQTFMNENKQRRLSAGALFTNEIKVGRLRGGVSHAIARVLEGVNAQRVVFAGELQGKAYVVLQIKRGNYLSISGKERFRVDTYLTRPEVNDAVASKQEQGYTPILASSSLAKTLAEFGY